MEDNLQWNLSQLQSKEQKRLSIKASDKGIKQLDKLYIILLYRQLILKPLDTKEKNVFLMNQYHEVIPIIQNFVFQNIELLNYVKRN